MDEGLSFMAGGFTMPKHDFSALFDQYPAIIAQMPQIFTSHQFILRLAQQHQVLYIEALCNYRNSMHGKKPAPFRAVHGILSRHLNAYSDLIARMENVPSTDIFGQAETCAQWKKR
jgi:hypothetical protein